MTERTHNRAVVERRHTSTEGLDYFPTPPWATRALVDHLALRGVLGKFDRVLEPCAGGGHMAEVLRETNAVEASDVHDYGVGYDVADVRDRSITGADWVITNPPFPLAETVLMRVIALADEAVGVALLLRTAWIESPGRYDRIFSIPGRRPSHVLQFAERVPMHAGRWIPGGKTATAYAWMVWEPFRDRALPPRLDWFPSGARKRFTRPDDVARFAGEVASCAKARIGG